MGEYLSHAHDQTTPTTEIELGALPPGNRATRTWIEEEALRENHVQIPVPEKMRVHPVTTRIRKVDAYSARRTF